MAGEEKEKTGGQPEPPEPPSKAAAAKAAWEAAKLEEETGPQKAQFMRWMDEWAESQRTKQPKPKTPTGDVRPKSFLERMLQGGDSA